MIGQKVGESKLHTAILLITLSMQPILERIHFLESESRAAIHFAPIENLKDDISRTSRAPEDIIGSLIFVGLALIIGPLVGLYLYFQKNENLSQGFHFHEEGQLLGPFITTYVTYLTCSLVYMPS